MKRAKRKSKSVPKQNQEPLIVEQQVLPAPHMKNIDDVKLDMSTLYDEVKSGAVELKLAAELANIAGKYLKAEQLKLAREIFLKDQLRHVEQIQDEGSMALPGPTNPIDGSKKVVAKSH